MALNIRQQWELCNTTITALGFIDNEKKGIKKCLSSSKFIPERSKNSPLIYCMNFSGPNINQGWSVKTLTDADLSALATTQRLNRKGYAGAYPKNVSSICIASTLKRFLTHDQFNLSSPPIWLNSISATYLPTQHSLHPLSDILRLRVSDNCQKSKNLWGVPCTK